MALFELKKVSRYYLVNKTKKYVLKDINLTLPESGLVTILGKSGSGKSTLLNLLGKIDSPSEGTILFNGDNISKYKEKKTSLYHNQTISFIFQHYHLLDNQTALYNVMLPCLIEGKSYKKAKQLAIKLFKEFSIKDEIINKKCADLSGGERERIAILRSFINEPNVILADEPTGALDKDNAVLVMEALKKISANTLVVLVTHNNELAKKYSDRIITMNDGQIVSDISINQLPKETNNIYLNRTHQSLNWINKIVSSNFKKRFKRNVFTIVSLVVGLVSSMLIFGFINGKDRSISKSMQKQFDYGTASINKELRIETNDSPITLIQTIRPSDEEIRYLNNTCSDFNIGYSYDALISPFPEITFSNIVLEDISYVPIYSFLDKSTNHELLENGKIPNFDTLNQVVVNQKAYETINKTFKCDCLNSVIRIKEERSYSFYTDDVEHPFITDYFVFDKAVQIVGVVKEINFLNTPKIYYSYLAMDDYMDSIYLNNLSSMYGQITWKERVAMALDNEDISSYTCRLFLKSYYKVSAIKDLKENLNDYSINSNALTIEETLFSLVEAASIGMEIFFAIALIGVSLIIGIISFASYNEDIKDSAILLCLGAKRDDVALIYIVESILLGIISLAISFLISILIIKPINLLIEYYSSLNNLISIPFKAFLGHLYLFPFLLIICTVLICLLATYIPIGFSKKISLKDELKTND